MYALLEGMPQSLRWSCGFDRVGSLCCSSRVSFCAFIKGRVKPRASALRIEAALLRLIHWYHKWYHTGMNDTTERKSQRWMLYLPPALLEQFRTLAAEHRRSLNSEMVWALEQY